ncbi:MAG: DUF503 domain-containing protein [Actinobacteria bacterium]|nr:DUF503 domain-containing protein [Actinomycetota bacterium]
MAADIHFPGNASLKDKRQHLRSLRAVLNRRLGASVAEVGYHDLWQRSRLIVSVSSMSYPETDRVLDRAARIIEGRDLQLSAVFREIIKVDGEPSSGGGRWSLEGGGGGEGHWREESMDENV